MKLIPLVLLISLCLIIAGLAYSLVYPMPSAEVSLKATDVNESYFINKLLTNHINPQNQNQLVITEEELNGYIAYRLKDGGYALENLTIHHAAVSLMDQELTVTAYGNYRILPVKIEARLIPALQPEGLSFTLKELKLSRIQLPKSLLNRFYNNSQVMLPLNSMEMIKVKSLILIEGEAVIGYEVDRERILEELFKLLIRQSN